KEPLFRSAVRPLPSARTLTQEPPPMNWAVLALTLALATSCASTETPEVVVLPAPAQIQVLRDHYLKAADELEAVDVSALSAAQHTERKRLIGVLREFGARGV